jgi:hypothetical protein
MPLNMVWPVCFEVVWSERFCSKCGVIDEKSRRSDHGTIISVRRRDLCETCGRRHKKTIEKSRRTDHGTITGQGWARMAEMWFVKNMVYLAHFQSVALY